LRDFAAIRQKLAEVHPAQGKPGPIRVGQWGLGNQAFPDLESLPQTWLCVVQAPRGLQDDPQVFKHVPAGLTGLELERLVGGKRIQELFGSAQRFLASLRVVGTELGHAQVVKTARAPAEHLDTAEVFGNQVLIGIDRAEV
jgi:hypothetical protein